MKHKHLLWVLPLCVAMIAALCVLVIGITMTGSIDDHVLRGDDTVTITSPDGKTSLELSVADGQLSYRVLRGDEVFMNTGTLGVTVGQQTYGKMTSVDEIADITGKIRCDKREIFGKTTVADDECVQAVMNVNADEAFTLEARVFDNGVAFRYILPDEGHRSLKSEETSFHLPADSAVWAGEQHIYYESTNKFYDPERYTTTNIGTPATIKLDSGKYAAILEADLTDYPGMTLLWQSKNCYAADFGSGSFTLDGEITTPWRLILVADDLNELVNNTMIYQVSDEADKALFGDDWVTPGRAAWSWITGRTTDRVTPKLMQDYTTLAARLGFEYNIIDEGWVNWAGYEKQLTALSEMGEQYGVGQILWTGVTAGAGYNGTIDSEEEAFAFIDFLSDMNMAGGKIDFFTTENNIDMGVNIYESILNYAAEKQLVVNFHGCNKPTGLDATYRNELNREAILGLESTQIGNLSVQAQMFVTQPFVRNLAGHADYTPAVDSAFHMAQLVLTDAPMQAIGSDPEDILASDALEMIKSVPTVWQETVVLPMSDIGKAAIIARKGDSGSWFVGGIRYAGDGGNATIELADFLGEGTYQCELWTDSKKGLQCETRTVTKDDVIEVPFDKLTGFIARFDRITLSKYGGEIDGSTPLTVTIHDDDTKVAYTLDGSEPTAFSKTLSSGDTLEISESCTLTLKIRSGEDKGLVESYRFNVMEN